jgi:hypothetical protein
VKEFRDGNNRQMPVIPEKPKKEPETTKKEVRNG